MSCKLLNATSDEGSTTGTLPVHLCLAVVG